jgi:hypothetical protein
MRRMLGAPSLGGVVGGRESKRVMEQVASARRGLSQPLAYVVYALIGVGVLTLTSSMTGSLLRVDVWQMSAIWLALTAGVGVLTAAGQRHHRALWFALIAALLLSFLQSYAEYLSLRDRLGQLHGDIINQANDVHDQLLRARYDAESLNDDLADLADPATAEAATRAGIESKVASDLTILDSRTQEASTHLQGLVKRLGTTAVPSVQGGSALSESTFASLRNLADDSVQETARMVQVLQDVDQGWQSTRTLPGGAERLQLSVNPRLWTAIDNASGSAQNLRDALVRATSVPIGDLFVVMAVLNLAVVLFPWLLLLLFVNGRRDIRVRQMYLDLWDLGGGPELLVRILDDVDEVQLGRDGYKNPAVRHALEDQTFSDLEYLLCLSVLTTLLTAGWHLVLYPQGALGLAQLLVNGVSVRDFAMYVVGNLNVITLGFLGAYIYGVGVLVRRFFASDLYPSAFLEMIERLITVFVVSLVLTILVPIATVILPGASGLSVPFSGLPADPNTSKPLDGATALAAALAFTFGIWTRAFFGWLPRLISSLPLRINDLENPQASVAELEGVDIWVEGRLGEEGIETVQAMATASIDRLVRRTYFTTSRIACWVDQALLYMHAGNSGQWMQGFRSAGVHKATDLLDGVGYAYAMRLNDQQAVDKPVNFEDVAPAVKILAAAASKVTDPKGQTLSEETVFEVCNSLWSEPNLLYVLNFYAARRIDVRKALIGHSAAGDSPDASPPSGSPPNGRDLHAVTDTPSVAAGP